MYEQGLVSVVIPTYKRHDMLERAIQSVINQTYRNLQVIIVNDNDPDDDFSKDAHAIVSSIGDSRVSIIDQPCHKNGAAARNYGIANAAGEFIAFLDDDDFWFPEKIEKQVEAMRGLGKDYGVCSTLILCYANNRLKMATLPYKSGNLMSEILCRRVGVGTCSVMIRHHVLDECGVFDESLSRHQELQLLSCIARYYKIYLLPEYLTGVDFSDGQNRPDPERFCRIKKDFYNSVNGLVKTLNSSDRRCFTAMHELEIANCYLKAGRKREAASHIVFALRSPKAGYYSLERAAVRFIGSKRANHFIKKYSPGLEASLDKALEPQNT